MKKLLLFSAATLVCLGASAQTFGEIFEVTDENGQVLESGATIVCDTYINSWAMIPDAVNLEAGVDFYAKNINEEPYKLAYEFYRSVPSIEEVPAGEGGFGAYQACYEYINPSVPGNCTGANDGETKNEENLPDVQVDQTFKVAFHQEGFTSLDPVTVHFTFYVIEAEERLEGATFDIDIKFTHTYDITNGVSGINAEAADCEYYNMQGVRVANPIAGQLYIVRQGGKTAKLIL